MILIPVKNLSTAKQRLAAVLDQPKRTELAQAMLQDVVSAIAALPNRPPCALVTGDPFATELARSHNFEIIPDPANPGETGAIEMATEFCLSRGAAFTLVIPADIPLVQARELEQIFAQAPRPRLGARASRRRPRNQRRPSPPRKSVPPALRQRQLQTASRCRPRHRQALHRAAITWYRHRR